MKEILSQPHSVSLKELLEDASESISDLYSILKCGDGSVFLNCFMDCGKINNNVLDFTNNFPNIYPLGENHPMLIVNHFLCVGSRIFWNVLFKKLIKLSEQKFIQEQMTDVLVDVVKILSGQYLRYFSYDAFCDLYDNIKDEVFNNSFVLLVKRSMNSKLLGNLQSRFDKVFPSKFDTV